MDGGEHDMSILIKGMGIPKEGSWVTLRVFPDGQCFLYSWCGNDFDFMEHLTAVPVPPHGDLIDRDAARGSIKPWSPEDERNGCTFDTVKKLMHTMLDRAPAIIPASEEGE